MATKSHSKKKSSSASKSSGKKSSTKKKSSSTRKSGAATKSKSTSAKKSTRKYSPAAQKNVEKEMHEFKRGKLKTGTGKTVKSRKQAIAIGLSEARRSGKKVPRKKS